MYKKINYAIGDVASTTAIDATTLTLKAGHTITTDIGETNKFVAVFYDGTKSSPYQDTNREIVEAYRTNTNDFVIARAKEGTSAKQWIENDKFMLIASAGVFNEYETEIASKEDALGYIAENAANKKTSLTDNSDTYYPTQKAVKTAVDAKQDALGYIAENAANKKTSLTDNSDTYYPTQKAVKTAIDAKQDTLTFGIANTNAVKIDDALVADNDYAKFTANGIEGVPYSTVLSDIGAQAALGYTAENAANKKTSLTDNSDTYYPTQKAVKTAVDAKANIASPTFTGTVTLPKAINIKDTSADHEYQLGVSELAANRTVTLPLLTGNDEFVFKAHTQTLTNKTLGTGSVINEATMTLGSDADGDVYYRASNKLTRLGKGTAGQVLTMNSEATAPQWSNPTAGGISWSVVTTDTTMAIDTGSLANKGTLLTLTLPATSAVGKTVRVAGMNAGLWKIAQGANQYIKFGNLSTTVGIGGSLASTQTYDAVELVCIEADKGWVVVSSIGNITVV